MKEVYQRHKEAVREWVVKHSQGPYASPFLFLFSYAETLFSPIPVETALVPLVLSRARSWIYYALLATAGSTLGSLTGYILGYFFYDTLGIWIVETYALSEEITAVREALLTHAFSATFIAAFTPFPDKVYMPLAGLLHVPLLTFLLALTLGRFARSIIVAYVTHRYGIAAVNLFEQYIKELTMFLLLALLLALLWFFIF